jgi:hypothetical protein
LVVEDVAAELRDGALIRTITAAPATTERPSARIIVAAPATDPAASRS